MSDTPRDPLDMVIPFHVFKRWIGTTIDYLPIENLLLMIDKPAQGICQRILMENRERFETARGSTHNHQTWVGGYIDHVTDAMNYAVVLHSALSLIGRQLPFTLSDALLVLFLHDLEKPWRFELDAFGQAQNRPELDGKEVRRLFREQKLAEYGLELTPEQYNALTYVEGEGKDYSSIHRVMNELAAFCHMCDTWSARGAPDYPKAEGDEWTGAGRFRTA